LTNIKKGAPLIWKYGSAELREKIMPGLLNGSKRTCITITEPGAGSDVKNISTTAEISPDGKHWMINGQDSPPFNPPQKKHLTFFSLHIQAQKNVSVLKSP
jgi:alkylation response protein AidB-like acyl-CoA dehydrogenase